MAEKRIEEQKKAASADIQAAGFAGGGSQGSGGSGPQWLNELRAEAMRKFRTLEWPTPQEEEWRRTDLSDLPLDRYLAEQRGKGAAGGSALQSAGLDAPEHQAGRVAFSDDECVRSEVRQDLEQRGLRLIPLPKGLTGTDGRLAAGKAADDIRELVLMGIRKADNKVAAWNAGAWNAGALLYVPRGLESDEPFWLDLAISGKHPFSAPHLFVYLESGSRVQVIQRVVGAGEQEGLCNAGVDVLVGENAQLDLVLVQEIGRSSVFFSHGNARVERDGRLRLFEAHFGGSMVKSRFEATLAGSGADVYLRGLYFSGGKQHLDIRSVQRHLAPNTGSRSFYKGAVRDEARTVYQGLIEVGPEAAGTDAYLQNKNLILNDGARADSIPSLRILTNDVKCSHGSTTGKVDKEQLFYLMSRGFSRSEAERMLIIGFFDDLIKEAPVHLQDELRSRVQSRIAEPALETGLEADADED